MNKQDAEEKIFALRKRLDLYAQAGNAAEVTRLQARISELQQRFGAVKGVGGGKNERTS